MDRDAMIRLQDDPPPADPGGHPGEIPGPSEPFVPDALRAEAPGSIRTFENLIGMVETSVQDAGQLLLFTGDHLRLEIMLLRHEKNPQVIWGLRRHEDWAFKATLLRFARGGLPVQLILSTEDRGAYQIRGWVVHRTMDAFWASPLPAEHAQRFWERCLVPFAVKNEGGL